ncbi:MAG: hypothetical protein OHK006_22170 [Thermodesulfovibrionales bacterium]
MKIRAVIIAVLVIVFCAAAGRSYAEPELVIGLIPEDNIFEEIKQFRAVAAYLTKKTGIRIKMTVLSRYGDVIDRFASRGLDGAFFGFFTSVLAMEKLGVEPVVRPVWTDGSEASQSFIFVRNGSGIKNAADMNGKRIAFVDRATVTGYLYAMAYLRDHGISSPERYFREISFAGNSSSTVYAVLDNRADVGVAKSKLFNRLVQKDPLIKEELAVIERSPAYPDLTLCLRRDLPKDMAKTLQEAALRMDKDPEGSAILKKNGMLRFNAASAGDFKPFADLARRAGISLRTYRYK